MSKRYEFKVGQIVYRFENHAFWDTRKPTAFVVVRETPYSYYLQVQNGEKIMHFSKKPHALEFFPTIQEAYTALLWTANDRVKAAEKKLQWRTDELAEIFKMGTENNWDTTLEVDT